MLTTVYVVALIVACAAIIAWNFVPSWRATLKGWSTIAEGVLGVVFYYFGQFAGAIQDAQSSGFLPPQLLEFVPFILLAWVFLKRVQTTTPLGSKDPAPTTTP